MMQVLGIAVAALWVLLMLVMAVVIAPAIFSFRPFDHRKVGYRAGVLTVLAMPLVVISGALYDGHLSPLRLQRVGELLALMFIFALIGALVAYINYRGMRSLSTTYAKREAALAERRQEE